MPSGHGITAEDKLLARKDKNAVDFVQTYSKTWCKCLKDTIRTLEKRAIYENDFMRTTSKLFQGLLTSVSSMVGIPASLFLTDFCVARGPFISRDYPVQSPTLKMFDKPTLSRALSYLEKSKESFVALLTLSEVNEVNDDDHHHLTDVMPVYEYVRPSTDLDLIDQAKETELHNTKRYRELIEVLKRQRTEFAKTREVLKSKWKADVKRMVDAESALFKAKSAYFKCCQAGVRLREDLTSAQASLDESQANLLAAATAPSPLTTSGATVNGGLFASASASSTAATSSSAENGPDGSTAHSSSVSSGAAYTPPSPVDPALMNAVTKYKLKVEKLERQLGDNDKKEMELMYAYKELVDVANSRLVELEKSRVEIICDTRLTVTKCDEVVSDSMAELISHLFVTRTKLLSNYEDIATKFQNYIPGNPYHRLLEEHIESGTDVILEKYQFEGYHDNPANAKDRGDAAFGKFVSRFAQLYSKDTTEANDGPRRSESAQHLLRRHSESESEGEGEGGASGNIPVLSSLVQFGSNLFRPDLKRPVARSGKGTRGGSAGAAGTAAVELDPAHLAALEAAAESEFDSACFVLIQCINGIESQEDGLQMHGIYRIPASKIKVAGVVETIRAAQETGYSSVDLSNEYAITLASTLKTRLIQLPEPLLSYNLYDQFVDVGKALETSGSQVVEEQVKNLHNLIGQLSIANQRVAGLLFHHLKRQIFFFFSNNTPNKVSNYQPVNQMGAANLATMFGPTVLRRKPKFNVANMMEFVDNTWLMKAVELCIDRVSDVFGPASEFTVEKLLKIIRDRAAERVDIGVVAASALERESSFTPASSTGTPATVPPASATAASTALSKSTAREAFFADMSGESARASQNTSALKVSLPKSEQASPAPFERKTSSRASEDSGKTSASHYHSSAILTLNKEPSTGAATAKSQESLPESSGGSSSGGGGLKRLISSKAQNLQQRLQNFSSESSSRAGRVFSSKKLLHTSSLRNSPHQGASRKAAAAGGSPVASQTPKEKTLSVAGCSYIDTGH
ncbi:hypothetical protein Aperf_G00000084555 [Anoplocephala perfoliata]